MIAAASPSLTAGLIKLQLHPAPVNAWVRLPIPEFPPVSPPAGIAAMTPPALLALGAGTLVCALTASACLFGWPPLLRQEEDPPAPPGRYPLLDTAERTLLLALVPEGHSVLVQSVPDPTSTAYANAVLDFLAGEGRIVESLVVEVVRGVEGTGLTHVAEHRRHEILVLRAPGTGLDRH